SYAFMAPEQRTDSAKIGPFTDLFSIGTTLFFLLTGKKPLDIHHETLPLQLLLQLPEPIRHFLGRAVTVEPRQRFQSARTMATALLNTRRLLPPDPPDTPPLVLGFLPKSDSSPAKHRQLELAHQKPPPPKDKLPKVLVVDDSPIQREIVKSLLEDEGYELLFASDGQQALTTASIEKPDLILLDVVMPGISGLDVCRKIRADSALKELPVVFVTGLDDEATSSPSQSMSTRRLSSSTDPTWGLSKNDDFVSPNGRESVYFCGW
ncbi:MAG: response regulator, partial [Proteobacteria bacterium]|nr:response regulator [Pseudomonadota bacterium]